MRRLLGVVCGLLLVAIGPAYAIWTASAVGAGTVQLTAVSRAAEPSVLPGAGRVDLSWPAVTAESGAPVTGYDVLRHVGSKVSTICSVAAPARACSDASPVAGPAAYGVVARLAGWRGPESPLVGAIYDQNAPSTTMSVSPPPNAAGWSRTGVAVTLTAEDDRAGVDRLSYTVDGGEQVTVAGSSASFPVSGAGVHTVAHAAVDRVGNVEATVTDRVRIDPTAPLSTLSTDASLNEAGWSTRPVAVALTAGDTGGSGVKSLTRQVNDGTPVTKAGSSAAVMLAVEGSNSVSYAATDHADNLEGTKSYTVKVDTVARPPR